jgi:outer membrane protein
MTLRALIIAASFVLFSQKSFALSLNEALIMAYQKHPDILAERLQVKATSEEAPQAFAGWLPSSSASIERGKQESQRANSPDSSNLIDQKSIDLTQPIYRGGRTTAGMKKASSNINQAYSDLIAKEQSILLEAVNAYMGVVRSQEHLQLAKHNQKLFSQELDLAKERFSLGEISKVDLAQAKITLTEATTSRIEAEKEVQRTYASFEKSIGEHPTSVSLPKNRVMLQANVQDLISIALKEHPTIQAKEHEIEAAQHDITIERSYILPSVDLVAGHDEVNATSFAGQSSDTETDSIRVKVSIPLFNTQQRGAEHSRIRGAKRYHEKLRHELEGTKNKVEEDVITAYQTFTQTLDSANSLKTMVEASETVLEGISAEEKAGAKTLLDVLEAKQKLFEAKNNLVDNQVDEIINSYALLAAIGRLTVEKLEIDTELYKPQQYHNTVQRKLLGF